MRELRAREEESERPRDVETQSRRMHRDYAFAAADVAAVAVSTTGSAGSERQQQPNRGPDGTGAPRSPPRASAGNISGDRTASFATTRTDSRKVKPLWVINSLANPRPTLNTYKYGMPGEEDQPQAELHTFDVTAKSHTVVKTKAFQDQNLNVPTLPATNLEREKGTTPPPR